MAITNAHRSRLLVRFIGLAMVVLSILAVTTDADCEPDRWKYYLAYRYYTSQKALGCGNGDASPGHLARKRYLGLSLRSAEAQAEDDCSVSQFSGIPCAGYIMNKTRSSADGATGDWTADLYRDQLPPEGLVYPCDSSSFTDIVSHTVVGLVRETVRECYSASAVAASSYCNSIIVKAAPATTVFATSTARVSQPLITTTAAVTTTVTSAVCSALQARRADIDADTVLRRAGVPLPSCVLDAQSTASFPAFIYTSACSCFLAGRSTEVTTTTELLPPGTTTATTTVTATTVVTETSIPTFALVVHPVGDSSTMYRLGTRFQGSRKEPTNRILTYIKPGTSSALDASFKGINATIIDGKLYIMSKNDKPKLYGFSKQFSGESQYAGRTVLARQPGNDKTSSSTALAGCTIDRSQGGTITCKSTGGEAVALQELAWPGRRTKGRFMLGLVSADNVGGEEDLPRMQLAAESFGSVVIGC